MKPYSYNSFFEIETYDTGEFIRFPTNATNLQYSWALTNSGQSYSRRYQTLYPKRTEQSSITASFIFRDVDEYLAFGNFMRAAHVRVSIGNQVPRLAFYAPSVARNGWHLNGFCYYVAVENVPMAVNNDAVAPKVEGLQMLILGDDTNGMNEDSSEMVGDEYDMVDYGVRSTDIKTEGEGAFR